MLLSLIATVCQSQQRSLVMVITFIIWALMYGLIVIEEDWKIKRQPIEDQQKSETITKKISEYLNENLQEGDRIQAHVSHTRGAIFPALLAAKAIPVTPYLENYLLYHDVDSPFVQEARHNFLSMLQANPPRYILYAPTQFGFRGEQTESSFMPFENWMSEHYKLVYAPYGEKAASFEQVGVYEFQGVR